MICIYSKGRDYQARLDQLVKMLTSDDVLILVSDGILNAIDDHSLESFKGRIYVLENDLKARGINKIKRGELISMDQMVALIANDPNSPLSW